MSLYNIDNDGLRNFFKAVYEGMASFKFLYSEVTGSGPEFVAHEMELEAVYSKDEPALGVSKGDTAKMKGKSLACNLCANSGFNLALALFSFRLPLNPLELRNSSLTA